MASTYLFSGREGVGQWPLAVVFAALLNCEAPVKSEAPDCPVSPCGVCSRCRNILALNHQALSLIAPIPSHKNLEEAIEFTSAVLEEKRAEPYRILTSPTPTSIPIAMAREVKRALSRRGDPGLTRVVLFYRMDKMPAQSADALLKLIEEPPPDTVIILTAERSEALLPTIQSRSQRIRFERVPEEVAVRYLKEHYDVEADPARLAVRISEGVLGRAIELATSSDDGESRRAVGFLLFKSLVLDDNPDTVGHLMDLMDMRDRGEIEDLLRLWQSLMRDCQYYAASGDDQNLVNVDFTSEIVKLSRAFENVQVASAAAAQVKNALADLKRNVHIPPALVALSLKLKADLRASG